MLIISDFIFYIKKRAQLASWWTYVKINWNDRLIPDIKGILQVNDFNVLTYWELLFVHIHAVYGKPVISAGQQSQNQHPDNPYLDNVGDLETETDQNIGASENQETERIPRPLSPTKLLPFISNPYRHQSDVDLEALRKKLYNAPRPLKKRSSITEPEGPGGPNIQKLLYQKATLAAMETTVSPSREEEKETTREPPRSDEGSLGRSDQPHYEPPVSVGTQETKDEEVFPPPPSHPAPKPDISVLPLPPQPPSPPPPPLPESLLEDFPPYPPPPYPSGAEQDTLEDTFSMKPPEVTGQVPLPLVSALKREQNEYSAYCVCCNMLLSHIPQFLALA